MKIASCVMKKCVKVVEILIMLFRANAVITIFGDFYQLSPFFAKGGSLKNIVFIFLTKNWHNAG
jgi:hypothetical protein